MAQAPDQASRAPSPGALLAAFSGAFGDELADLLEGPASPGWPSDLRPILQALRDGYELAGVLIYEATLNDRNHRPGLREKLYESLANLSAREIELVQVLARWRSGWFATWRDERKHRVKRTPFATDARGPAA